MNRTGPASSLTRGLERLTDLPVALLVRALGALLARIGPRGAYLFARLAGDLWPRLCPRRRRIALRNLEIAFRGALAPALRERLARESCRHAIATAVDVFIRDRAITPRTWDLFIEADRGLEELLERPRPRGLVILSAHLGDWEMVHHLLALRGLPVAAVARLIHNPHLDRLVTGLRTRHGATVIPKAGGLRGVWKTLRAGGAAGLMTDQSAPPGEPYLRFFGARGATYFQYARLLARLRPEVAFVACLRVGFALRFRLETRDLTGSLLGPGTEEERAARLVRAYLETVEEAARTHPEQYLWMHRRWKYRPPGAPDLYRSLHEPLDPRLLEEDRPLEAPPAERNLARAGPPPAPELLESEKSA